MKKKIAYVIAGGVLALCVLKDQNGKRTAVLYVRAIGENNKAAVDRVRALCPHMVDYRYSALCGKTSDVIMEPGKESMKVYEKLR